ncbi:S8 family peptidase [Salinirubrum litoreum]|uniref:S8 family serine peptidase n=1 Tax=Salinirubrum litoreum TaxID=1126234 RepID=A0ABD5RAL8_9EURY|nr:S8 family serine peptidase [Salinirubrum litoreum]
MSQHSRRTFMKLSGGVLGGIAVGTTVTAAERTDRFLVETKKTSAEALESAGLSVVYDLADVNMAVVEGSESALQSEVKRQRYAPDVEITLDDGPAVQEADYESATDEPLYPLEWDKQAQNIPEAHEISRGEGARVAVIDDGVLGSHPDLEHAYNAELSENFTGDGNGIGPLADDHGTHVAGTIAANDQNEEGVVGTAPAAEIVDCRVFSGPSASFASIFAAIYHSVQVGCDVANLSLGAYPIPRQAQGSFYGGQLNKIMTYANSNGTLLVIAAGNDSADLQHDGGVISLPNEGAQALSVAATGPIGFQWGDEGLEAPPESPAFYTNYGTNAITVAAPGGDADLDAIGTGVPYFNDLVLSTTFDPVPADTPEGTDPDDQIGSYGWKAGTSMACPQVAGAAALLVSANPDASPNQIEATLKNTASVPEGYDKAYYGAGFIDPVAALRK